MCAILNTCALGRWEEGSGAAGSKILCDGLWDTEPVMEHSWRLKAAFVLWPQDRQVHFPSDFCMRGYQGIFRAVLDECCEDELVNAGMILCKYRGVLWVFCRPSLRNPRP